MKTKIIFKRKYNWFLFDRKIQDFWYVTLDNELNDIEICMCYEAQILEW